MKKWLIAVYVLAMAYILAVPSVADASTELTYEIVEDAIEQNYGCENLVMLSDVSGNLYMIREVGPLNGVDAYEAGSWTMRLANGAEMLISPAFWSIELFRYDDGTWTNVPHTNRWGKLSRFSLDEMGLTIVYAKKDVTYYEYSGKENGTIFFVQTPTPLQMTELAKIVEKSKPQMTLWQVISLLPLVIFLVVSFLGLRKCLQALRTILHGA